MPTDHTTTPQGALERVRARQSEYDRLAKMTGAGDYPQDNVCARCDAQPSRPLIPSRRGWLCSRCSYGKDGG
jgi:hypothetical protein